MTVNVVTDKPIRERQNRAVFLCDDCGHVNVYNPTTDTHTRCSEPPPEAHFGGYGGSCWKVVVCAHCKKDHFLSRED